MPGGVTPPRRTRLRPPGRRDQPGATRRARRAPRGGPDRLTRGRRPPLFPAITVNPPPRPFGGHFRRLALARRVHCLILRSTDDARPSLTFAMKRSASSPSAEAHSDKGLEQLRPAHEYLLWKTVLHLEEPGLHRPSNIHFPSRGRERYRVLCGVRLDLRNDRLARRGREVLFGAIQSRYDVDHEVAGDQVFALRVRNSVEQVSDVRDSLAVVTGVNLAGAELLGSI